MERRKDKEGVEQIKCFCVWMSERVNAMKCKT